MNDILKNIIALRNKAGMSQENIAQELGIDASTYGRIERGTSELTYNRLVKIAEILKYDVVDVIRFPDKALK